MSQDLSNKNKQVEEEYTMLQPIEHILNHPDSYVGNLWRHNESQWILNEDETQIVEKTISYIPSLYKIYNEILVNAADNYQRDKTINYLNIQIKQTKGFVKVQNNGRRTPVMIIYQEQKIYVPEIIFRHVFEIIYRWLLTVSNILIDCLRLNNFVQYSIQNVDLHLNQQINDNNFQQMNNLKEEVLEHHEEIYSISQNKHFIMYISIPIVN